ncbi:SDR family oxidoreductase [Streptosporangium sp. NPDC087985]|uniref:SDR family oxidoreductase n=1 Tax=Streptosporangium sp. NPDC087985 TaxID=3366196 RepID=UPI003820F085
MLLVTGATGTVGRPLIDLLISEGAEVRAVTRNPRTASLPVGVEVVEGDPSRPDTITSSLRGVTTLFLNPAAVGDAAGDLLTLAREQGVKRVVQLSALAVVDDLHREHTIATHHKVLEEAVTSCDVEWVILRPGMFAANTITQWAGQIRAGNVVRSPYAASTDAPIHERDLAEVAVRALLTDGLVGQSLSLTGPQSLTRQEMVAIIGQVLNRPLSYQEI